jgi:hypothetical protein
MDGLKILEEFTKADSNIKVLISTVAFGMGVNITDIDIVVHWGLPTSPLSYWQEVGRFSQSLSQQLLVFSLSYSSWSIPFNRKFFKIETCISNSFYMHNILHSHFFHPLNSVQPPASNLKEMLGHLPETMCMQR